MTYNKAKQLALKINGKVNAFYEFDNAYRFYDSKATTVKVPDNDVVVLKSTGKIINYTTYLLDYATKK